MLELEQRVRRWANLIRRCGTTRAAPATVTSVSGVLGGTNGAIVTRRPRGMILGKLPQRAAPIRVASRGTQRL